MKSLILRYVTGSVVLLALWDAGSRALVPEILPDPLASLVLFAVSLGDPGFLGHIGVSLVRLIGALAVAVVTGFSLGLWFGHSKKADWLGAPLTFITLPLPKIVLLPVFFTVLGLGDASRVLLIALATGYQILVIVRESALALDPSYEMSLRSMGATAGERFRHAYLPAALPALITSLKVSLGTALAVLFLAESFATDSGLGWLIMDAWGLADMGRMFTGILGMCVLGLLFYGAIGIAQKLLCPWMR